MTTNGTIPAELQQAVQIIVNSQSALVARKELAGALGFQYSGDRDIYREAGYPQVISFERYLGKFLRQDIARRIVRTAPVSTWRQPPQILDGVDPETAQSDTPFCKAWLDLVSLESNLELTDVRPIWHYLRRVDVLSGIGRYSVLLLGVNDGRDLGQELGTAKPGRAGVMYLTPYTEQRVEIREADLVKDPMDPRFGLPNLYQVTTDTGTFAAHWTRVIHVTEDLVEGELYGEPRLKAVFNRLEDLEKVLAAAGESAWKLMYKGLVLSTKDGYAADDDAETDAKVDEYIHKLRRFVKLEGFDVDIEGGEVVDPSPLVDKYLDFVAASTQIPKRILLGSERGELASSQDEKNWDNYILDRKRNYAEPVILRPLINRFVKSGVLPAPSSGSYCCRWPSGFSLNELEEADRLDKRMSALQKAIQSRLPLRIYLSKYERWTDDEIAELEKSPEYKSALAMLDLGLANNG